MHYLSHHVAIYGPPGAGKSALVERAVACGRLARDLEDVGDTYSERQAFAADLGDTNPTLFGAADLCPEDLPAGTRLVLLAPSSAELVRRVRLRGDAREHKWIAHALQVRQEHLDMAEQGVFDLVVRDGSCDEILDLIAQTFDGAPE
jgi:guanylate kinase